MLASDLYISKAISSKTEEKHDTYHIFCIKQLVALQYEVLWKIFKNMDSNWIINESIPGFEGSWDIDWCNMWCKLWPDLPVVLYTTHMLHQTMTPQFYY